MSPNRVVAILTPLLFAPLAGSISALAATHFPGINIPASKVEEVFIAGALIALAKGAQWLNGWQKHEEREAGRESDTEQLRAREAEISAREAEFDGVSAAPEIQGDGGFAGDELLAGDEDLDADELGSDDFDFDDADFAGADTER